MTNGDKHNLRLGLLFISPWILGFLALCVYPLLSSLFYSMCDYSALSPAVFVGAQNYRDMFTDAIFWKSVYNTVFFAAFAIPLGLVMSLSLAILLNFDLPGKGIFRTVFFLPSLVPMVCLAVLWQWMLNGDLGLVNNTLKPALGLQSFQSRNGGTAWHQLMAASTLVVLPVMAVFFFTRRAFVEGIAATGGKN